MRSVLVGNTLALVASATLLALYLSPTTFKDMRYRPIEVQVHTLIMLYCAASQAQLRDFVRQKMAQQWQWLALSLSRKSRRVSPSLPTVTWDLENELRQLQVL
jgi:hypothetical protein